MGGSIDMGTPKGAYVLLAENSNDNLPAVEGRCIVLHSPQTDGGKRIGVGKIVCDGGSCKAKIGPYPTTTKTTAPKATAAPTAAPIITTMLATTAADSVSGAVTKIFVSLS